MKQSERILIAGYEIGGQMQLLAETFRKRGYEATACAFNNDYRGYKCDQMIGQRGNRWTKGCDRFTFFLWAAQHFDVFHFFWGVSLWGFSRFHHLDLPILKRLGRKVVVHFRGLDVVDIAYFDWLRNTARGELTPRPAISRPEQLAGLARWRQYADHLLVSEPDLFEVVPEAILSPQVIDTTYWSTTAEPLSAIDGKVRIVHAPSSRRKKGTDFIEAAVYRMKSRGLPVELVMAEDLPHNKIKEYYTASDIGLDQILYGWHGKVSVELMALGRPVVCYIRDDLRPHRPDLPIVSATPDSLEKVLEDLVTQPDLRKRIGTASKAYAKRHHDVEVVVDQLLDLYGVPMRLDEVTVINSPKKW
jgi:glycosyltransferase involved in cell wall biosynthesis